MIQVNPELLTKAKDLGIEVKGNWGDKRIQEAMDDHLAMTGTAVNNHWEPKVEGQPCIFHTLEWANERAAKIWEGQSTFLTIADRVGRIRAALKKRGFTRFDELIIPTNEDYKIYL